MAGNVWEWCSDWYDANYFQTAPLPKPAGPSSGMSRVLRGGSWVINDPVIFRGSYRSRDTPDIRNFHVGFRCAAGL